MKFKILAFLICIIACLSANAQINQCFDNSNYKAIYFKEACDLIAKNTNVVLLDVRSPGEYADISKYVSSNIGKYTFVHTQNGQKLFCDHMLAVLEEKLSADFIRVQKSYIVNKQKVVEIHKYSNNWYTLVLNNQDFTRIITGPSYFGIVKEVFEV